MAVELSQVIEGPQSGQRADSSLAPFVGADERAARRALRAQIARLERELSDAFVTAFTMGGLDAAVAGARSPSLACWTWASSRSCATSWRERLHEARAAITRRADEQEEKRLLLERMLLEPGRYRFYRVSCQDLGEPGCGVWQVRPRLGLIGMLMGWWQVKLSSGCPLAGGRGPALGPARP